MAAAREPEHVHDMLGLKTYTGPQAGCPYYPCGNEVERLREHDKELNTEMELLTEIANKRSAEAERLRGERDALRTALANVRGQLQSSLRSAQAIRELTKSDEQRKHWSTIIEERSQAAELMAGVIARAAPGEAAT